MHTNGRKSNMALFGACCASFRLRPCDSAVWCLGQTQQSLHKTDSILVSHRDTRRRPPGSRFARPTPKLTICLSVQIQQRVLQSCALRIRPSIPSARETLNPYGQPLVLWVLTADIGCLRPCSLPATLDMSLPVPTRPGRWPPLLGHLEHLGHPVTR